MFVRKHKGSRELITPIEPCQQQMEDENETHHGSGMRSPGSGNLDICAIRCMVQEPTHPMMAPVTQAQMA